MDLVHPQYHSQHPTRNFKVLALPVASSPSPILNSVGIEGADAYGFVRFLRVPVCGRVCREANRTITFWRGPLKKDTPIGVPTPHILPASAHLLKSVSSCLRCQTNQRRQEQLKSVAGGGGAGELFDSGLSNAYGSHEKPLNMFYFTWLV